MPTTCAGALLPTFSLSSELPIQNLDSQAHPLEGVATHRPLLPPASSLGLSKQLGMAPGSAFSAAPFSQQPASQQVCHPATKSFLQPCGCRLVLEAWPPPP